MKRVLTIAATIIVLVGIGAGIYFYFFVKPAGIVVAPAENAGFPIAGQGVVGGGENASLATTSTVTAVSARLIQISKGPVVPGEVVVNKSGNASSSPPSTSLGTGETVVWYIERQSGNVFSYLTQARTLTRTSNKTIPGIQSAMWLPDASLAFVRYLSGSDFTTINTYALPTMGTGGFFLLQNLSDIAVSATNVLSLASGVNGSIASLMRIDGTRSSGIFTTPLSAARVSFAGKNQYLIYTKPSATLLGDAFLVDSAGHFSRIAGPHEGLVALASPSGKWVLVSYTLNSAIQMELVDTAAGETLTLPVATIADKCVWADDDSSIYCGIPMSPPSGYQYPDDWYQGAVQFSDRIWKIDVSGRYAQLVLDFQKETRVSLDATALAIDPADTTLVFVNKNDSSLWSYSL